MNNPWLVSFLFFAAASLAVLFVNRYYHQDYKAKQKVNYRLSLIERTGSPAEAIAIMRRERGFAHVAEPWGIAGLHRLLVQSGLRFESMNFWFAVASLFAILTVATTITVGFHLINLVFAFASTLIIVYIYVKICRTRRIRRFNEQLPDVLDMIVRSLRAGHPLPISLGLVAREMQDPAGTEFGIAFDEISYGLDTSAALQNLSDRVGDQDLLFVIMSTSIQTQTGGNLGEILSRLSKLIRERYKLRRKIHSLTAEARYSGVALTALPVVLFGLIKLISPGFYGEVWGEPIFRYAMVLSIVMLVIGNFVMRRIANFKY